MKVRLLVVSVVCLVVLGWLLLGQLWTPETGINDTHEQPGAQAEPHTPTTRDTEAQTVASREQMRRPPDNLPVLQGWRLEGTVENMEQQPIASVRVRMTAEVGMTELQTEHTRADKSGHYGFDLSSWREKPPLVRDRLHFKVSARAPNHLIGGEVTVELNEELKRVMKEGGPLILRQDLILQRGAVLSGRVVDSNGNPVEATIRLKSESSDDVDEHAYADVDGRFYVNVTKACSARLVASESGVGVGVLRGITLNPTLDTTLPDLVLEAKSGVAGIVVYPDGQPIVGFPVTVARQVPKKETETDRAGEDLGLTDGSTRTGQDGRFEILGLRPGRYVSDPNGFYIALLRDQLKFVVDTEGPPVRVVVPCHRVRVETVDADGNQIPGVPLTWIGWFAKRDADVRRFASGTPGYLDLRRHRDTIATGGISSRFVQLGSWWLISNWGTGTLQDEQLIRAAGGGHETIVRLRLSEGRRDARLSVLLSDIRDGSPLGFALKLVRLDPGQQANEEVIKDDLGQKTLRCNPGIYRLEIEPEPPAKWGDLSHYFRVQRQVALRSGAEATVKLKANKGGLVKLTVHLPAGIRPDRRRHQVDVTVRTPRGEGNSLQPFMHHEKDGMAKSWAAPIGVPFICERPLAAGRHVVTVTVDSDCKPKTIALDIVEGRTTSAEVWLENKEAGSERSKKKGPRPGR